MTWPDQIEEAERIPGSPAWLQYYQSQMKIELKRYLVKVKVKILRGEIDVKAKKSLGQNFLFDPLLLSSRIIDAAGITREDAVVEIGPGPGR